MCSACAENLETLNHTSKDSEPARGGGGVPILQDLGFEDYRSRR